MKTRTLLQLPYQVARTPLAVVDAKLVKRLPADSAPRLAFERIVGSIDEVAGRLLNDKTVERRGTGTRARAETLTDAVQLERDAAERRSAAADTMQEAERQAGTLRQEAQRRQRDGVQQAVETERNEKQAATRRARAQASPEKQQADARAARRLETVEEKRKLAETRAAARKQRVTAMAKAELGQAAQKRATAATRRSEAEQLGELSAAKKQARKGVRGS